MTMYTVVIATGDRKRNERGEHIDVDARTCFEAQRIAMSKSTLKGKKFILSTRLQGDTW